MTFLWPWLLWSLLLFPATLFLLAWASRRRAPQRDQLVDQHLAATVVKEPARRFSRWLLGLQLAALAVFLVGAARPQASLRLPVNKAAVVIAIDASRSMLAEDVDPSRLEHAKALAQKFVSYVDSSTPVGLVSFSDVASVLVPPTTDRQVFLQAVERITTARNTSLVSAVVAGVQILPGREDAVPPEALRPPGQIFPDGAAASVSDPDLSQGHVLILSDGVSTAGGGVGLSDEQIPNLLARFATDHKVRLSALPVGREGGAVQQIDGQNYFIPFDAGSLEELASAGNGEVLFPADDESLQVLAQELGRDVRWEPQQVEVSSVFVGLGLTLMAAAALLSLQIRRSVP